MYSWHALTCVIQVPLETFCRAIHLIPTEFWGCLVLAELSRIFGWPAFFLLNGLCVARCNSLSCASVCVYICTRDSKVFVQEVRACHYGFSHCMNYSPFPLLTALSLASSLTLLAPDSLLHSTALCQILMYLQPSNSYIWRSASIQPVPILLECSYFNHNDC